MKITRLRKGYRIIVTDSEFAALSFLVRQGQLELENGSHELTDAEKRGLRGRLGSSAGAMHVDQDNR